MRVLVDDAAREGFARVLDLSEAAAQAARREVDARAFALTGAAVRRER